MRSCHPTSCQLHHLLCLWKLSGKLEIVFTWSLVTLQQQAGCQVPGLQSHDCEDYVMAGNMRTCCRKHSFSSTITLSGCLIIGCSPRSNCKCCGPYKWVSNSLSLFWCKRISCIYAPQNYFISHTDTLERDAFLFHSSC